MHAIQTSGNDIRNITADPHAGATADEVDDPRIWAEAIRQWSTFHPEFSFLPRKFKIAVTGLAGRPRGDQGLRHRPAAAPRRRRRAGVRGAGRRRPRAHALPRARRSARACRCSHLLSYLQAILRVYNRHGRRDNIWKARIKVLVAGLGAEGFAREVEEEWEKTDKAAVDLPDTELARIRAAFAPRNFETLPARSAAFEAAKAQIRRSPASRATTSSRTRSPGYAIVDVALKTPGETPGDCSAEQMDARSPISPSAIRWTRRGSPTSRT